MLLSNSRTYNSILNSLVGIFASVVTIILNFFVRVVIVRELGEEINGIHNLFQSITSALTIIELGFTTAMVIHLYKPLAERNNTETDAIVYFYKRIYLILAAIYIAICIIVNVFFIDSLVKSSLPISVVRVYFTIFMLITPFSYLTYNKVTVLYAEQKNRIRFIISTICQIFFRGIQIITLIYIHSYTVFLILLIFEQLFSNLLCLRYVDKHHPYLKSNKHAILSPEKKSQIYKTVRPILVNNIAANVQTSAKGILIGLLMGNVSFVGYFGNYQLVTSTVSTLFSHFGGAFTSSFGNLSIENDKQHMFDVYRKVSFILNWFAIILSAGFFCCIQPFIAMSFGKDFLLSDSIVIILTLDMFIYLLNLPIICIQNAMGLHRQDQYIMLIQALLAILLAYILGKYYSMEGLLIGLLIPQFLFTLINKGLMINKIVFNQSYTSFLIFIITEIIKGGFVIFVCYLLVKNICVDNYLLNFLLKGISSLLISIVLFFIFSFKNKYFLDVISLIRSIFNHKQL